VTGAFIEFYALQGFADACIPLGVIHFGETKRSSNVFRERHARQKI